MPSRLFPNHNSHQRESRTTGIALPIRLLDGAALHQRFECLLVELHHEVECRWRPVVAHVVQCLPAALADHLLQQLHVAENRPAASSRTATDLEPVRLTQCGGEEAGERGEDAAGTVLESRWPSAG